MKLLLLTTLVALAASQASHNRNAWWSGDCGKSRYGANAGEPGSHTRVVGGEESAKHEFPWMTSLRRTIVGSSHFCGAVIIHPEWLLTAAHCVSSYGDTDVQVEAGDHDRSQPDDDQRQFRTSTIVQVNPLYNTIAQYDNDLALIKVSPAFNISENVTAVCAPDPNEAYVGWTASASGWGALFSGGPSPSVLHWTQVNVVSNEECSLPSHYPGSITSSMICAGGGDDFTATDTCQGDSGGPLVAKRNDSVFEVIGLTSWGRGCADGSPGVYNRVSEFMQWSTEFIAANP